MNQSSQSTQGASRAEVMPYILALFGNQLSELMKELSNSQVQTEAHFSRRHTDNLQPRFQLATSYFLPRLVEIHRWLLQSVETSNFTYAISEANRNYLAAFCSVVTGLPLETIDQYINEIYSDQSLRDYIKLFLPQLDQANSPLDSTFDFGRRVGWYVLARAAKPKIIVETGVAQGLGSLVLASALMRNHAEGHPGTYYGTDINPQAGLLFDGAYKQFGRILYGDSIESLKQLQQPIDLFINDSDHSAEYEMREYQTIINMLSPKAIILGDNSHVTDKLCLFARQINKRYLFFKEQPANHWYPGAGIGVAF